MIRRSLLGLAGLVAVGGCCFPLPCLNCETITGLVAPIVISLVLPLLGITT